MTTQSEQALEESLIKKIEKEINRYLKINRKFQSRDIVYFMSVIRKLLEITDTKKEYYSLNFFSNWILHYKLDKNDYKNIIKDIYDCINLSNTIRKRKKLKASNVIDKKGISRSIFTEKLCHMFEFKKQLIKLLNNNNLNYKIIENCKWWFNFRNKLMDVLSFCPYEVVDSQSLIKNVYIVRENSDIKRKNPKTYVATLIITFKDDEKIPCYLLDGTCK